MKLLIALTYLILSITVVMTLFALCHAQDNVEHWRDSAKYNRKVKVQLQKGLR